MRLIGRTLSVRSLGSLALVLAAACGDDEPSTPSTITPAGGTAVTGQAGGTIPVTVRVAASNGRALSGQIVTFSTTATGSTVTPTIDTTDASGDATTQWKLGTTIGVQTLTASVAGLTTPATVAATVTAGAPASVTATAGNAQTGAVGAALATRPAVTVRDAGNNPVAGVQVNFVVTTGGGSGNGTATTDASGVATGPQWTLGPTAGAQTLQALVAAPGVTGSPVTFTATGTAGAAARIEVSGNTGTGTGTAGTAVPAASLPSVIVRDANGNPVSGVAVTFAVTGGGGSATGLTATTNAQGVATIGGLTLGNTAGANTITASAAGVTGGATFVITGTAGPAARGEIAGGNTQSVRAGGTLQVGPSVRVVDQFGNPRAGVTVNFVVTGGGASLLGATQTTNAQGIATVGGVTLGTTPGTNTIEARITGVTAPVVFTATALAGTPATITIVSGDSLITQTFRPAGAPFIVEVRDSAGFAVRNTPVTFAIVSGGGGSLASTSVTTDTLGRARVLYTATGFVGVTSVTATAGNLTPVTFTITTVPTAPAIVTVVSGQGQTATVGTAVAANPTIEVRDAQNNPVPGVTVFFQVVNGGGIQNTQVLTDSLGRASSGTWQLGPTAGTYALDATVSYPATITNNPIRFTATASTVPVNVTVEKLAGDLQTATRGTNTATQPAVVVRAGGTALAGVTVTFSPSGDGTATPITVQTDASGIARTTWRLSTQAGSNTLIALVANSSASVVFTATGQ
jgi:adhesin/invasin